jgi:hypothetical protein
VELFVWHQRLFAARAVEYALSCLVEPSDLSGLVNCVSISAGSVRFFIDNARVGLGGWACDASCFADNPTPDLQAGSASWELRPSR